MKSIITPNGIIVKARLLKITTKGRLYISQDRLILTDLSDNFIKDMDIIDFLVPIL